MTIDWNAPLETDEPTPRPATFNMFASGGYLVDIGSRTYSYPAIGFNKGANMDGPPLRNVRQPALRTSDEALQRMEKLVRKMSAHPMCGWVDYEEAADIVKLLPEPPVDPDLIEAERLQDDWLSYEPNKTPYGLTLAAIKRGRELANG